MANVNCEIILQLSCIKLEVLQGCFYLSVLEITNKVNIIDGRLVIFASAMDHYQKQIQRVVPPQSSR